MTESAGGNAKYIVVNIGCIECGVTSNVVAVYVDKASAEEAVDRLSSELSWREGGQNAFEVFEIPRLGEVVMEYRHALDARDA